MCTGPDVCEVCGLPATMWVRDHVREGDGTIKPEERERGLCDKHRRLPQLREFDETAEQG